MLGYGPFSNSRFNPDPAAGQLGLPLEWESRGGLPMFLRGSGVAGDARYDRVFTCVHGGLWNATTLPPLAPFRYGLDGDSPKGAGLTSWNDLGFAVSPPRRLWVKMGENGYDFTASYADGGSAMRADNLPHRAATPFGRPYEAATDHPWQVNILSVPMRVLEPMIVAYVPPASRATTGSWGSRGRGVDLFTKRFAPAGIVPFPKYPAQTDQGPTPAVPGDQNYWTPEAPTAPQDLPVEKWDLSPDTRTNAQRYPGALFFAVPDKEVKQETPLATPAKYWHKTTSWESVTSIPRQVSTADDTTSGPEILGVDALGLHIVFYAHDDPAVPPLKSGVKNNDGYYSPFTNYLGWARPLTFLPISPFSVESNSACTARNIYYDGNGKKLTVGSGTASFRLYRDGEPRVAAHSYWNRVSFAFAHAVLVTQIANLADRDPADARSQRYWPSDYGSYVGNNDSAGIIYNPNPHVSEKVSKNLRKGVVSWDPKASDFASLEHVDRQFLANLGESFSAPGMMSPDMARLAPNRPPRFARNVSSPLWKDTSTNPDRLVIDEGKADQFSEASMATFGYGSYLWVGEYRVTNNIRSLLLPFNATFTDPLSPPLLGTCNMALPATRGAMTMTNPPPRGLWLLDEWNAMAEPGYVPGDPEVDRLPKVGPYLASGNSGR